MRLRLRSIVTYVPTAEGLLFRAKDSFVSIRGKDGCGWFDRLLPFLDGRVTVDDLLARLDEQKRQAVGKVLATLREADMLYDAAHDDPNVVPQDVKEHYASTLGRIEAKSTLPSRVFARFRQTKLLVLAPAKIALSVLKAGMECGLSVQTASAPDWNSTWEQHLITTVERYKTKDMDLRVEHVVHPPDASWSEFTAQFDAVIVAGHMELDRGWIETTVTSRVGTATPLIPLLLADDVVLAGTLSPKKASCVLCLMDFYRRQVPLLPGPSASRAAAGASMGAYLLLQLLQDALSGAFADEGAKVFELDLRTLQVQHRPWLRSPGCRCRLARKLRGNEGWSVDERYTAELMVKPFVEGIRKNLVDPKTGLIARLEEGELLQLPYHQSAAFWHPPGGGGQTICTTERGDDPYLARVAVIRRTLEEYVLKSAATLDPDCELSVYTPGTGSPGKVSRRQLLPGIVVSGLDRKQLTTEAFFRGLAFHAYNSTAWSEIPLSAAPRETSESLIFAYLQDIQTLQHVKVERYSGLPLAGCEVLRFSYKGDPVTAIAGLAGDDLWTAGLSDVWLHITAREAFAENVVFSPSIRFRCPETPVDAKFAAMNQSLSQPGLSLALVPLLCDELRFAEPFVFVYAFLQVTEFRIEHAVVHGATVA